VCQRIWAVVYDLSCTAGNLEKEPSNWVLQKTRLLRVSLKDGQKWDQEEAYVLPLFQYASNIDALCKIMSMKNILLLAKAKQP
jgi:hypothetical protein